MRDGTVDSAERAHLNIIAHGLRYGMALLLLASLGLVVASYTQHAALQPALSPTYWTFIAFAFVVIGVSWALSRRRLSFPLCSATLFTAWRVVSSLPLVWVAALALLRRRHHVLYRDDRDFLCGALLRAPPRETLDTRSIF